MRAAPFSVVRAGSTDEAIAALAAHGDDARVIAGGQSLAPLMALRLAAPAVLVDLARVSELDAVTSGSTGNGSTGNGSTGTVIGAMVRQRRVELDHHLSRTLPLLADALPWIGHAAIRNQGTICGSLAHADPAAELPAVAITSNARLHLRSRSGARSLDAHEFFTGYYSTAIQPDELLESVEFPTAPPHTGSAFVEFSRRHGDFAIVGVAATVTLDGSGSGAVADATVAVTGVASTPWTSGAPLGLVGAVPDRDAIAHVADALRAEVEPGTDLHATAAHRRHLVAVLTARALTAAVERAGVHEGDESRGGRGDR